MLFSLELPVSFSVVRLVVDIGKHNPHKMIDHCTYS